MSIELGNLTCLKLNLFVEINLLLSNNIKLSDLVVNDILSFLKSGIDFVNLLLDFFDLLFSLFNHLVAVLDLILKMVDELLLFGFLEVISKMLTSFGH